MSLQVRTVENGYIVEDENETHVFNDSSDMLEHLRRKESVKLKLVSDLPLYFPPWVELEGTD